MNIPLPPENIAWYVQVEAVNIAASDVFADSRHEAAINFQCKLAAIDNTNSLVWLFY